MKVAFFNTKPYEMPYFNTANSGQHHFTYIKETLTLETAHLATGCNAVCCFVTDQLNHNVLAYIKNLGINLVALRSAGYDHVDLAAAKALDIKVVRVPSYSPQAIAEFTVGMILALSRKLLSAHERVRHHNFSLEGLLGYNLQGKSVGIIGTGHIGTRVAKILTGFDCKLLAYDPAPNPKCQALGVEYTSLEALLKGSEIITLHCLLNEATYHLINKDTIALMQPQAMLINTGRGGLVDTLALITALKQQKIGAVGLDVYEHERGLFFADRSQAIILDDDFIRLQAFPNVLITGHQAYLSEEALINIAQTTLLNLTQFEDGNIQNQL